MAIVPPPEPPPEVVSRLKAWHDLWWWSAAYHYALGILGVACSAVAATELPFVRQAAATLAGVCFAVIGFVNPQRRYLKFVRAWRILDAAVVRYRYQGGTVASLLRAMARGEALISGVEHEAGPADE